MQFEGGKDTVWIYPNGAPNFGIRYFEGNPDRMTFSASDNNNTTAGADLCINGNGDGTVTIRGKTILHAGNYTSYTVTKTGGGASGTWGINITGNAVTSSIPLGFSYREASWTWGTLTAANGYTLLTDWITPASGGLAFADKGSQVSCQIDGYFYQDEGRYMVLDTNNYTSYAPTKTGSGASGTWGINVTGSAGYADGSNYAYRLTSRGVLNNITTAATTGAMVYDYNVLGDTPGIFPVWHNANAILTLNKHGGNYDS
jgi:hypothetical protein